MSVAGVMLRAQTTAEVREQVQDALAQRTPLRVVAGGQWLDAGRPGRISAKLAIDALSGVVEYTPGDLTLTARAATSLQEIARVTARERQWLALDPFGSLEGTIGATIATASAGPLAHAFGTPRDHVLGIEVVTGDAKVVRAGGRVVKNVAGFDLARLFTGSWGTLGVITEVTVRLRALPEVDQTVALPVPDDPAALDHLLSSLRQPTFAPLALELVNASLAKWLGLDQRTLCLIRLGGNAEAVRAQHEALATLNQLQDVPSHVWATLRTCEPERAAVGRFSGLPSRLTELWMLATQVINDTPDALLHASIGRGIVRSIIPASNTEGVTRFLEALHGFHNTVILERLPGVEWWSHVVPPPPPHRLIQEVKHAFDPAGILNPGILGEQL